MKFLYADAGVSHEAYHERSKILSERIEDLKKQVGAPTYSNPESFLKFPDDTFILKKIETLVLGKGGEAVKHIFVVGIGGANLATKAVYDALIGFLEPLKNPVRRMIFLDTDDPSTHQALEEYVASLKTKEECIVIVVSKSGETLETITNAKLITGILERKFGDVSSRVVVVTKESSPLAKRAKETKLSCIFIPEAISDRFSAFSPVALVPLSFLGVDVKGFLLGAHDARETCLHKNLAENPAALCAAAIDVHAECGVQILDSFFFVPALKTLGEWYRQLVAESLGKDTNRLGVALGKTITPTVSVGTTDLHSMLQLSLSDPSGRFTDFVRAEEYGDHAHAPSKIFGEMIPDTKGKSAQDIVSAIYTSVKQSYRSYSMPFTETILPDVSSRSLGEYMMHKMIATLLLGTLWDVDVFNQPNVEEYKRQARKILGA